MIDYVDNPSGQTWHQWLRAVEGVKPLDVMRLLDMDIKAHAYRGEFPTADLLATRYLILHGPLGAFDAYTSTRDDPSPHVGYLLLHPELVPDNFAMFKPRRRDCERD
jgi:hypothetical protein